ncbi:hypothetical protein HPC49_07855 [Pyxidicoccus fallax]|uniref:Uncharacterized protein n=1 Tax=Pyxidicoccus fallax TaxID=394095 RepID=A0A848LG81_9BACT|nr:hypothetical protein [Pyxidicoccus fallax]NMO16363.1 hypothetical protein [Pyxidicoccus fallax]NPC78167.1 hypothetical protein [Pyxidicoccus fallax]
MPTVSVPKPTDVKPSPQTTESLAASIVNQTSADLVLVKSASALPWIQPPPQVIQAGKIGQFNSPGDFSNAANGYVVYQGANGATFSLEWAIPSVGKNSITWQAEGGLSAQESGSLDGWNVSATWFIS